MTTPDGGVHVLAIRPAADGVTMLAAPDDGSVASVRLEGDFTWRVGQVRRCVGTFGPDLGHTPCPTQEPVSIHRQCHACSGLDDADCVFEPRCANDPSSCTCLATFKGVPHAVYLAFHGTLPKVGMTTLRRVPWRLREQGADAYFVVQECRDRPHARSVERQVSYVHKVPEHRGHRETLPQLARPVPWGGIEERAAQWRDRLAPHYALGPLVRIADHPLPQPVPALPRRVPSAGLHHGTWLGAKGNHLLYRERPRLDRVRLGDPGVAAVKLSDLVGRSVAAAHETEPWPA